MKAKGLVLFHGAGSNKDSEQLVVIEDALQIPVRRCNFPYRDKKPVGPAGPNGMATLVETVNARVQELAAELGCETNQIAAGGRSLGGRACSVANADGLDLAGLILLSYPLHPPGKPDKLRISRFGDIGCPVLVVQGEKDPFGNPHEIKRHFAVLKSPVHIEFVPGNHSPKDLDQVAQLVSDWLQ